MKRNLFWLVMGGLAVGWVLSVKHCGQVQHQSAYMASESARAETETRLRRHLRVLEATSQHPPGFTVVHENGATIVRGPDHRIVSIQNTEEDDADDRETVDGLPVPVVRGTRTTEAKPEPPKPAAPPKRPRQPKRAPAPKPAANATEVSITGLRSATPERARRSVRDQFERSLVLGVLKDSVPADWHIPDPLLDRMIREVNVAPIVRDYGTVYEATLKAQLSPRNRDDVIRAYRQQEVRKRMVFLGVILALALVALAVVSGYIKADEATKGYYTSRLRAVALAVLGAGATLLYVKYLRS